MILIGVLEYIILCNIEINKINGLQSELLKSKESISNEIGGFKEELRPFNSVILEFNNEIEGGLTKNINEIISKFNRLNNLKIRLVSFANKQNQIDKYKNQISTISGIISDSKTKREFSKLSTSLVNNISKCMAKILRECKYPELTSCKRKFIKIF